MTDLIIPVKPLANAKQRLAGVLSPDQRASLVLAMLQDLLGIVSDVNDLTTWVVSSDQKVLEQAGSCNCRLIKEPLVAGYNPAITYALNTVRNHYKKEVSVAFVPADLPLVSAADLSKLIKPSASDEAVIRLAPSHDQRGTNGVYLSSGSVLSPCFGENSFNRYRKLSQKAGIVPEVLFSSTFARDIDTPDDLQYLYNQDSQSAAVGFLHSLSNEYNYHVI